MSEAFFEPLGGDRYRATEHTRGPWSADHQHAGPAAALLGMLLSDVEGGEGKRVARLTCEILRPLPLSTVAVETEVRRPGRRVDLVAASVSADGEPVLLARCWRYRTGPVEVPDRARAGPAPAGPEEGRRVPFFDVPWEVGYHTAMDWRAVAGSFVDSGAATVWLRPTIPIVAGEPISPLARVLVAADSGNGISATADPRRVLFVNTELTVHLHRHPVGDWVCLDSATTIDDAGAGLASTDLSDERGRIGRSAQALYVEAREA